jgi:O-acetyl-ADP-ribose deacetylase (regulator of RNase III)
MIRYIEGDMFSSPAQTIVNTVNIMGVMGKGIALSFKNRYPKMFTAYRNACEKKQFGIGKLMLYNAPDYLVLLFPTKEHWRNPSKIEYIEAGLKKFVDTYAKKGITSIAFPRLGCGNGELAWDDVRPLMEKYLQPLPIDVYIYLKPAIQESPEHKTQGGFIDWLRNNAKDMSSIGIKDDIVHQSAVLPLEFQSYGKTWGAKWDRGLILEDASVKIAISEDEFFTIWNDIRNEGVLFVNKEEQNELLIYDLLDKMGYISSVKGWDTKDNSMTDGYQVNEGLNRAFALGEAI